MTTTTPQAPYQQYLLDSQNWWAERYGSPKPPAPTYRMIHGRKKLGRFMDPFGCMALMESQKVSWEGWYKRFLISAGGSIVLAGLCWLSLPFLAVWYLGVRAKYRRRYDHYYGILQEIQRTNDKVWMPYSRHRLNLIDVNPRAIWP